MEEVIFLASFIFSFAAFLIGVIKNSFVMSLSGSLLLVLFSIITIVMSAMYVEANTIVLNVTDSRGSEVSTIGVKNIKGDNPYTFVLSLILGMFSCFFLLYTVFYLRNPKRS